MTLSLVHATELEQRNHAVDVIDRITEEQLQPAGQETVLSSRDATVLAARAELFNLIPADFEGVTRWFLPVAPSVPSSGRGRFSAYRTCVLPGDVVAVDSLQGSSHALKVVVSGSIVFGDRTLAAGDWLWIPRRAAYSFTAGDLGAVLFTALPCVDGPALGADGDALERIDSVDELLKRRAQGDFITSRDLGVAPAVRSLRELRHLGEAGRGVRHDYLPFAPHMPTHSEGQDGRFFAWLSLLGPDVEIPRHSHSLEKLADYKVVINGSIYCRDQELTSGDWLWAPAGGTYSFRAGERGALLLGGWPHN